MMNPSDRNNQNFPNLLNGVRLQRGMLFGLLIIGALLAFETFNYSTTDFALGDLLGDLRFAGVKWSTILAIAFCGIDFAGIARLFTPQEGADEPTEVWYLFAAWMLAATMNAMLTWWGVSLAIANHQTLGNSVVDRATLLKVVPIFVAVMVWVIRVLIIGSFSVAGDRLFSVSGARAQNPGLRMPARPNTATRTTRPSSPGMSRPAAQPLSSSSAAAPAFRSAQKPNNSQVEPTYTRPEPTYSRPESGYHPAQTHGQSGNGNGNGNNPQNRRQL